MTTLRQREPRHEDERYRRSFAGTPCESCGIEDGTTVPAHVNWQEGGLSMKAHDWLIVGLCFNCHREQTANPGPEWWVTHVLKVWLKRRYFER